MNLSIRLRALDLKTKQVKQQVSVDACIGCIIVGLHVMSRDFSDECPCSGGRVILRISVMYMFCF